MPIQFTKAYNRVVTRVESLIGHYPEFVFVSTGRAGSNFISRFLTEVGIPTSHEGFFHPEGIKKRLHYQGDASWLAVPFIEDAILSTNIKIIHHVRHPLEVIRSLKGINFFNGIKDTKIIRFASRNFQITGDEIIDCVRWWNEWNLRCEKISDLTFKIEDFEINFPEICSRINKTSKKKWKNTLEVLSSKKINSRNRDEVRIEDIPEGKHKDELIKLAEKYEYELY